MTKEKQPTLKDTKSVIFAAYQDLLKERQSNASATINPSQTIGEMRSKETISKVDKLSVSNLNSLQVNINNGLTDFISTFGNALENYTSIGDAIKAKEAELKELFGIEKEAFALASLIDAQRVKKEQYEEEFNAAYKDAEERQAILVENKQKELSSLEESIIDTRNAAEQARKREQDEYKYNFERQKMKDLNQKNDELQQLEKESNARIAQANDTLQTARKEFDVRAAELESQQEEVVSLRQQVENMPSVIKDEVKAKVAKEKTYIERHFKNAQEIADVKHEGELSLLRSELASDKKTITGLQTQVEALAIKLDAAYKELRDLASDTVKGAGATKALNDLMSSVETSKK